MIHYFFRQPGSWNATCAHGLDCVYGWRTHRRGIMVHGHDRMNLGTKGYCKILTTSEPCHFTVQELLLRSIGKHDRVGTHGASEPMSSNGRYHLSDITHALVIPAVVSERVAPPFHTTQPIDPVSGLLSALTARCCGGTERRCFLV